MKSEPKHIELMTRPVSRALGGFAVFIGLIKH